jgi:membrane-associated phospholipid phosphatase
MTIPPARALALALSLCFCPVAALAQDSLSSPIPSESSALDRGDTIDGTTAIVVPTLGGVLRSTGRDLRALPSWTNFSVLAGGLVTSGAFLRSDSNISARLSSAPWAEGAFEATSLTGQFAVHAAAGLVSYGIGRATASPHLAVLGADLVRAQILAQGTTQALKVSIGRARPDGTSHSFPSGHTSTMFATATVLNQHFGWKAGVPAYAAATYVAAGRIQTRRHYLSDVTFGAALGVVAGRTVTRFALIPIATPEGGAGAGLTLVN